MSALILPGVSIRLIQQLVASRYKVTLESMRGANRARKVAWPRQTAIFLSHEFTHHSLSNIGRIFGRDHSTVIWSIRRVRSRIASDPKHRAKVDRIRQDLAKARKGNAA